MNRAKQFITDLAIPKRLFVSFLVSFAAVFYFTSYAVFGNKGIVKYFELRTELHQKNLVKNKLLHEMENKKTMVSAMSINSLDLDLLDEQVRKNLGFAGKGEVIIYDNKIAN